MGTNNDGYQENGSQGDERRVKKGNTSAKSE